MISLTRKYGQSIFIDTPDGTRLRVLIQAQHGRQVKVCIEAPRDYAVLREEIADRLPLHAKQLLNENAS